MSSADDVLDVIGPWSEVKLEIVRSYASAYSKIMSASKKRANFRHIYIDAFAGAGIHVSKETKKLVAGSPLNALMVDPPFDEYHFIDLDCRKVTKLEELAKNQHNVHVYPGDCNTVLQDVLPTVEYSKFRRALCLLDPYGLHLDWRIIELAGKMHTVEIFLNFPVLDMNRNVLWSNPDKVDTEQKARMDRFWGDDSWRELTYEKVLTLFGEGEQKISDGGRSLVEGFRKRLKEVAGFAYVPSPMPMRNRNGAVLYYLFFAAQKPVAAGIVSDIFKKHGNR